MHNADNLTIMHSHDDHVLEQTIDTWSDPVFGYLGYQLSQVIASKCEWVLDPKYNTNIVITVPFLEVDSLKNNIPYFWTIPYTSLISPVAPPDTSISPLPAGFDPNLLTPLSFPPNGADDPANHWRDFARFVWNQFTLKNY